VSSTDLPSAIKLALQPLFLRQKLFDTLLMLAIYFFFSI
jgi:hypothetical protein